MARLEQYGEALGAELEKAEAQLRIKRGPSRSPDLWAIGAYTASALTMAWLLWHVVRVVL